MGKPSFSDEFKRDAVARITERGYLVYSMSWRGNCHDNAVAEGFFYSLKHERIPRRHFYRYVESGSNLGHGSVP